MSNLPPGDASQPAGRSEYGRKWRAENAGKVREYNRTYGAGWYAANRDRKREQGRQWYLANRDKQLENTARNRLLRMHGMLPEAWSEMWDAQGGKCYLCQRDLEPGATDIEHDRRCCGQSASCRWCRRGLACHSCNVIAGFSGDDPARLVLIAANLRVAMQGVAGRLTDKPVQGQLFSEDQP